jgi:CheY-like chemotaxis protein
LRRFTTVTQALACVERSRIDVALIDYALTDQNSEPLQTALERRDIPFVLLTGYPRVLVRRHDHQNVLSKPVSPDLLCEAIMTACR